MFLNTKSFFFSYTSFHLIPLPADSELIALGKKNSMSKIRKKGAYLQGFWFANMSIH